MSDRPFGNYGDWSISYLDAGNETGTMSGVARVVQGDDDDSNIATQIALWDTFVTRSNALKLGDLTKAEYVFTNTSSADQPTNGANRELKLLVQYQNTTTGKRYKLTLPTLNGTIPVYVENVNARDVIRMDTPTAITQFITAFNAFVVDPQIPNIAGAYAVDPTIEVIGLKVVGRNI